MQILNDLFQRRATFLIECQNITHALLILVGEVRSFRCAARSADGLAQFIDIFDFDLFEKVF